MPLKDYRRKRNFRVTAEPRGGRVQRHNQPIFVIQKHAASHLHYDFRLELDGVLKSWAVPKGPSLDPGTKRLAMQVEDHPIEYGGFEGIIPKGEYGGGTVMLWDLGTWEPIGDAHNGYRDGALKFVLQGEKLRGGWMLVRKGGHHSAVGERHWFLFKEKDRYASAKIDVTAKRPLSVTTGRDLDKIAQQANRIWGRHGEVAGNGKALMSGKTNGVLAHGGKPRPRSATEPTLDLAAIRKTLKSEGAKRAAQPRSPDVQLATLVKAAPEGMEWVHEIKFDGYRMLCRLDRGRAQFISRNGKDWTSRFPMLVKALQALPVETAIVDGEVVVMQADGTTSFQALQNALQSPDGKPFLYYVFDLLYLQGFDIRPLPLEVRKEFLQRIIPKGSHNPLQFS